MDFQNVDFFKFNSNFPENDVNLVKLYLTYAKDLIAKLQNDIKSQKCIEKAAVSRIIGNSKFSEKNYFDALKAYNESLCWAPVGSECIGIAYANRSAIYLNCGFYKLCMENIKLALENNYPERLKPKLIKRKAVCLEKMKIEEDASESHDHDDLIKLTYPANPKIPYMIDGLVLKKNAKYGRHIVTTRDLKPGDIVMIEKPFIKSPDDQETVYIQCFSCCKSSFLNLHPCRSSTKAMFCSQKCSDATCDEFYQQESTIIDGIVDNQIAIECRCLLKAFKLFGDLTKLEEMIDLVEKNPITFFDVDINEADEMTKFRVLFSLNVAKPTQPQQIQLFLMRATAVIFMLKQLSEFKNILKTQVLENKFIKICLRTLLICSNMHELQDYWLNHLEHKRHSKGLFFVSSLFSHACVANIHRVAVHGRNYLIANQSIKAGEQLFDNYGADMREENVKERRKRLYDECNIECDCEACTFETNQPLQELSHDLYYKFPWVNRFWHKFSSPKCSFDENFFFISLKTQTEIIEYLTKNQIKYSKVLLELVLTLRECLQVKIGRKPLNVLLMPKNDI